MKWLGASSAEPRREDRESNRKDLNVSLRPRRNADVAARDALAQRCRLWRRGAGGTGPAVAMRRGRAQASEPAAGEQSAGAASAPFSGAGEAGHFSVHGRRAVASRHVRSQAPADCRGWQAVQDEDGADAIQQQRQHAGLPLEIRAIWPKRLAGQRVVSPCRPARRRTGRGAVDDVEVFRTYGGQLFFAYWVGPTGPAQHGGLVRLWIGKRMSGFAWLRRAQRRADSAWRHR